MKPPETSLLFKPFSIGPVELKGRFVKGAWNETMCTRDGHVTDQLLETYEELAIGGTPLLITGAMHFCQPGQGLTHNLAIDDDDKIAGLRRLTDTVHRHESKIFAQLYHVGRQKAATPGLDTSIQAVAPSAIFDPATGCKPREMTIDEIRESVQQWADAAKRAKKAGFDGVELHGSHGYLISQFLTPHTNRRKDEYGGSPENRRRYLLEVYREIRKRVGKDFAITLKMNGHDLLPLRKGLNTSELLEVAQIMELEGLDAVTVTCGHYESGFPFERARWWGYFKTMTTEGPLRENPAWYRWLLRLVAPLAEAYLNITAGRRNTFNLPYAREFKRALNIPVISIGGFSDTASSESAIANGDCDMVAAVRALIANPHMYNHMHHGIQGPKCNYCQGCFARVGAMPAVCYEPQVSAQRDQMLLEARSKRREQAVQT